MRHLFYSCGIWRRQFDCLFGLYNDLQSSADVAVGILSISNKSTQYQLANIGAKVLLPWAGNLNQKPGIRYTRRRHPIRLRSMHPQTHLRVHGVSYLTLRISPQMLCSISDVYLRREKETKPGIVRPTVL